MLLWPDARHEPLSQQPPPEQAAPGQQACPGAPQEMQEPPEHDPPVEQVAAFARQIDVPGAQQPAPQVAPGQQG